MTGSNAALSALYVVTMKDVMINKTNKDNTSIEFLGKECNDLDNEFEKQEIYVLSPRELGLEEDYTNEANDTLSYSSYVNEEQESQYETIENKPKVRSIGTKK